MPKNKRLIKIGHVFQPWKRTLFCRFNLNQKIHDLREGRLDLWVPCCKKWYLWLWRGNGRASSSPPPDGQTKRSCPARRPTHERSCLLSGSELSQQLGAQISIDGASLLNHLLCKVYANAEHKECKKDLKTTSQMNSNVSAENCPIKIRWYLKHNQNRQYPKSSKFCPPLQISPWALW